MATYNTAFGALPGVESLTGMKRSRQDEEQPRDFLQQRRAQEQAQRQQPAAPAQTFAQMQAAGQARPAPPMLAPAAAPAAPAQPPMLQQLQQQLAPTAAPAAAQAPMAAPAAAAPVTAPAPSVAVEPPLVSAVRAELPPIAEDGSRTFANVEVPVANAPQYTPANPPPPTAPNGSTYRDVNGLVYTKRSGVWSAEAKAGQTMPTGYGALTPTALQGQTTANLPQGATSGFTSVPALDSFLTRYGVPSTPEETARLAAMAGMTPDQLQAYIQQPRREPFLSQEATAAKQQADADQAEFLEWYAANPTEANEYAAFGGNTGKYKWVPARLRNGGPALQLRETAGAPVGEPAGKFGIGISGMGGGAPSLTDSMPTDEMGGPLVGGQPDSNQPVGIGKTGQPGTIGGISPRFTPVVPRLTPSDTTATPSGTGVGGPSGRPTIPTFAPVTFGAAPTFAPSAGVTDLQTQIREVLAQMQAAPSPFESEAYKAQLAAAEAELGAQYGAQRSALEEQLARQGLSASTFGAGRYGDLAGQQARALAGMRADLLKEAANQQAERQQVLLQGMTALSGQMSQQELQKYQADINLYQTSGQLELDSRRLQQDAALRGVELSLQEARDLALRDYQNKSLDLQLKEILSREAISGRQISSQLLSALIPSLDLSALSPEQVKALFEKFGLNLGDLNVPVKKEGSTPPPTPGGGGEEEIESLFTFPDTISQYKDGKRLNINGTIVVKRGNGLYDPTTNALIRQY